MGIKGFNEVMLRRQAGQGLVFWIYDDAHTDSEIF